MKTFLFVTSFLLASLAGNAWALSASDLRDAEFKLDQASPQAMAETRLGHTLFREQVHTLRVTYDFAVLGGAIGTYKLLASDGKPAMLPKGAIVRDCIIDVLTQGATSASGTAAIGTGQAGNDLKAATAAASYTGLLACVPVGTAATAIKLTADRTPTITIATGALTNGKWNVLIHYELSD